MKKDIYPLTDYDDVLDPNQWNKFVNTVPVQLEEWRFSDWLWRSQDRNDDGWNYMNTVEDFPRD